MRVRTSGLERTPAPLLQHREDLREHLLGVVDDEVVAEPEHQIAPTMLALFRPRSFLTCRGSRCDSPSVSTMRQSSTRKSTSPTPGISTCLRTCSPARRKAVLARTSSSESARGMTRSSTDLARRVAVAREFAAEEGQADVPAAHSTLDHHERPPVPAGSARHGSGRRPVRRQEATGAGDAGSGHVPRSRAGLPDARHRGATSTPGPTSTTRSCGAAETQVSSPPASRAARRAEASPGNA